MFNFRQTNNEESCEHGISLYECEHECEEILSGSASQNNEKNDERLNSDHEITHFASFGCVRPRLSPSQVERRIRAIPPPEFVIFILILYFILMLIFRCF